MARPNATQQAAKLAEAVRLARQGYSRRQINPILRAKYGEGIRPAKYTPIYRERVATTVKRLEAQPAPRRLVEPEPQKLESKRRSTLLVPHYSRPTRTMQGKLYRTLRSAGFSGDEAIPMEKYWRRYAPPDGGRKQLPPFLVEMLADRKAMKEAHEIEARAKGWGAAKSNAEFGKKIRAIYEKLERKRDRSRLMGKFKEKPFITRVWVKAKGNRPGYWKTIPKTINVWALKEATLDDLPVELQWDS